jgi:peptidoglycan/LPS O-acetylase OafA/YrhL
MGFAMNAAMDTQAKVPRLKFGGIEAARAIAAMLVAAYHGSRLVAQPRYAGVIPGGGVFGDFNLGVDFFFVVSGFLITWVHWADIGKPGQIRHYAWRRVTRIYPAYWVALAPMLVARLLSIGMMAPAPPGPGEILCAIFLLPNAVPPPLGVAWTLIFEIMFYALFALTIMVGRRMLIFATVWACAIIACHLFARPSSFPASFLLSPYNLEFLLGVASAIIVRKRHVRSPALLMALGGTMFLALMLGRVDRLIGGDDLALRIIFGLSAAAFIVGNVELERSRGLTLPAWLTLLGAASYSIYLVHSLVEPAILRALWPQLPRLSPTAITLGLMGTGTVAGLIFHKLIEKPLMRLVRQATATPRPVLA